MLSGNTDCYQLRKKNWKSPEVCLKVMVKYRSFPVSIISKRSCPSRPWTAPGPGLPKNLVHFYISITTSMKNYARVMTEDGEAIKRLQTVEGLAKAE